MRVLVLLVVSACSAACGAAECPEPVTPVAAQTEQQPRLSASPPPQEQRMTLEEMDRIVQQLGTNVVREGGMWQFQFQGVPLTIVTDARANRMRIVAPVEQVANLTPDQHEAIMVANFHTALDARYAVSRGLLFSAFIHPLSTLHPDDLESGIRQTATLAQTFGTTYNSGALIFGGP